MNPLIALKSMCEQCERDKIGIRNQNDYCEKYEMIEKGLKVPKTLYEIIDQKRFNAQCEYHYLKDTEEAKHEDYSAIKLSLQGEIKAYIDVLALIEKECEVLNDD